MIGIEHYLRSAKLFRPLAFSAIPNRKTHHHVMSIELMLLAVTSNFAHFSY